MPATQSPTPSESIQGRGLHAIVAVTVNMVGAKRINRH